MSTSKFVIDARRTAGQCIPFTAPVLTTVFEASSTMKHSVFYFKVLYNPAAHYEVYVGRMSSVSGLQETGLVSITTFTL
jgi:hypothetical protein